MAALIALVPFATVVVDHAEVLNWAMRAFRMIHSLKHINSFLQPIREQIRRRQNRINGQQQSSWLLD